MAGQEYEELVHRDADTYSDASGSDIAGDQSTNTLAQRRRPRTSEDVRQHDRETITAEEEAERLLVGEEAGLSSIFRGSDQKKAWFQGRGTRRQDDEEKEGRLHDIEQGEQHDSEDSSEVDMRKLGETHTKRRWKVLRWTRFVLLHVLITLVFILLLFGAYKASNTRPSRPTPKMISNGTSMFAPTTIIISLDGFRADFLQRGLTPTLNAFIRDGVSPKYMLPSFPSVTFPNHFTLATGHYPESHGIVGNTFWDPIKQEEFYYTDPYHSLQSDWWNADPFWLTAELNGVRSAVHMWPGSEAHLGSVDPAYVDHFKMEEELNVKVDRILEWLDLPGAEDEDFDVERPRPQLIAAYVPDIDTDGHIYGPNSTEIRRTITRVDNMLADLFRGIDTRNLTNIVNIIVVSDHGMATTDTSRLVQLDELIDMTLIQHVDGWPLYGLRPYDSSEEALDKLYDVLLEKSKEDQYKNGFEVYLRDKNMPERYHFSQNQRIAPLWIIPKTGWALVTEKEFNVKTALASNTQYHPRGLHGYDFEDPLMRAIFVARGPAFPHPKGSQVNPFQNIEVYNIVCDSLGIDPAANNGTIRLPFKTSGKHDETVLTEAPADPPSESFIPAIISVPIPSGMPPFDLGNTVASQTVTPHVIWTTDSHGSLITVLADADGNVLENQRPWTPSEEQWEDENLNNHKTWWGWFQEEYDDFKDWAGNVFHQDGGPKKEGWEVEYNNTTKL